MSYINCKHSRGSYKMRFLDTKGDKAYVRNAWFTRCALCGDDEEIGFDCGKAVCPLFEQDHPETRGRRRNKTKGGAK